MKRVVWAGVVGWGLVCSPTAVLAQEAAQSWGYVADESLVTISPQKRLGLGPTLRDYKGLQRKVEEQGRLLSALQRQQGTQDHRGGASGDLATLSRSVAQLDRSQDAMVRRVNDLQRSVDSLSRKVR